MDIWLSLKTTMRFVPCSAALLRPSNASPPESDPSPMTAITLNVSPRRSRALARPVASETLVAVCPTMKGSCGDSDGSV